MALIVENEKIVGKIDNLQDKLEGKLPLDRLELLYLVNSWGRLYSFNTNNDLIKIDNSKSKECYDLSKLDVSKITNMDYIFKYSFFDGDISNWDVSNVKDMYAMFYGTKEFNQPLDKWDVSNVTNMKSMFESSKTFNQDISNWDVSKVTSMSGMFYCSYLFNQDISQWNVFKVNDISEMFKYAKEFNQPLNNWDVSNVINMCDIFSSAISFNQPLNNWNVSKVTNMNGIFSNSTFNQDIGNWDVSNVTTMEYMFYKAINFNQNIGKWNLNNVCYAEHMFYGAQSFINKYNNSKILSFNTINLKNWFNENKNKMNEIDIKENHGVEIDNFFSKFININIEANSIQKKEI